MPKSLKIIILFLIITVSVSADNSVEDYPLSGIADYINAAINYDPLLSITTISENNKTVSLLSGSPYIMIGGAPFFTGKFLTPSNGIWYVPREAAVRILQYFRPDGGVFAIANGNITCNGNVINPENSSSDLTNGTAIVISNNQVDKIDLTDEDSGTPDNINISTNYDFSRVNAIIIDPGHGGNDPGAVGYNGIREKDIVLRTALMLSERLRQLYPEKKIVLTRDRDVFISLEQRSRIANFVHRRYGTAIFISIHVNASLSNRAYGFETWHLVKDYTRNIIKDMQLTNDREIANIINLMLNDDIYVGSRDLAEFIQDGLQRQIGDVSRNRGIKEERYFVIKNSIMPAVLVEIGFNTNRDEGIRLTNYPYLSKITNGIIEGVQRFFSIYE